MNGKLELSIIAVCLVLFGNAKADLKCIQNPVDIVFVVDSSSSIWPGNYDLYVLPFIKDVVNMFDVGAGANDSRIGVITFNNDYHLQFHLNKFLTQESVMKGIEGIRFTTGNTFTNKALKFASETMFTQQYGARSNVQHLIIVLTDGESDKPELTKAAALEAKNAGIDIFTIGVGNKVKYQELKDMASEPSEAFVFQLTDFTSLRSNLFSRRTCSVLTPTTTDAPTTTTPKPTTTTPKPTTTTPKPTTTTPEPTTTTPKPTTTTPKPTTTTQKPTTTAPKPTTTAPKPITTTPKSTTTTTTETTTTIRVPEIPEPVFNDTSSKQKDEAVVTYCGGKPADIFFVLDSSSSVWIEDFNVRMLGFVRDIVSSFEISPNLTRVGMVIYSDTVKPVFGLKSYTDKASLLGAIQPDTVKYMSGRTNTADAIKFVRERGFGRGASGRQDSAHVIIVVTDGISKDPRATRRVSAGAQKDGVIMFSIGVGPYIDQTELNNIASDPDQSYVFNVQNYGALSSIRNVLAVQACNVIPSLPKDREATAKPCAIRPTNIHFIYKSSGKSLNERAAIQELVYKFTSDEQNKQAPIHLGITTDYCKKETKIPFSSMESFRQNLDKISSKKQTKLYSLIRKVRRQSSSRQADRDNTMVLFIDESTTNLKRVTAEAMRAKFQGFKVFLVTVGDIDSKVVSNIASTPTDQFVQNVDEYADLYNMRLDVLATSCAKQTVTTVSPVKPSIFKQFVPEVPSSQ